MSSRSSLDADPGGANRSGEEDARRSVELRGVNPPAVASLLSPRRTFARVQPTTKNRVDLGLRLEGQRPSGRLQPSKLHETMQVQIGLASREQVDSEVVRWLRRAYEENR